MRRTAALLLLVLAALAPLGCAGADGKRAQELLAQSDQALAAVESYRFSGRLWLETPVGDFTFVMRGGGSSKKGGSSFVTMDSEDVPEFPATTVVVRGDKAWTKTGGRWVRTDPPPGPAGIEQLDFTQFVTKVEVTDGHTVAGEPAVKIVGVLDTGALVESVFAQLGAAPGSALPDLSQGFGDTRVVLYLSETSHLPLRTLVDLAMDAGGERLELHMDFAITDVNEPVKIPRVR